VCSSIFAVTYEPSTTALGRPPEIANGRFVEAKRKKSVDVRRAAIETTDGQVWVDTGNRIVAALSSAPFQVASI
jgi:hypothetical protein